MFFIASSKPPLTIRLRFYAGRLLKLDNMDEVHHYILSKYAYEETQKLIDEFKRSFFPCDPETTLDEYANELEQFVKRKLCLP